jgi:hypothetical protein
MHHGGTEGQGAAQPSETVQQAHAARDLQIIGLL